MPEPERPLFEELLDVVFYAPIGALSQFVEEFPSLVDEGRHRFETRLAAARITGRFTVATLRRRIADLTGPPPTARAEEPDDVVAAPEVAAADPVDLAIPGYDSLAASQVVARLAGLTRQERTAVGRYEEATRGRRTILGRIAQLDAEKEDD